MAKLKFGGVNHLGSGQRKILDSEFGTRGRLNHERLAKAASTYFTPELGGFAVGPSAKHLYIPRTSGSNIVSAAGGPALVRIDATDTALNERSGPAVVSSRGSNAGFRMIHQVQITADEKWAAYLRSTELETFVHGINNASDPRWRVTTELCYVPLPSGAPSM
jgi:hypothetical protein